MQTADANYLPIRHALCIIVAHVPQTDASGEGLHAKTKPQHQHATSVMLTTTGLASLDVIRLVHQFHAPQPDAAGEGQCAKTAKLHHAMLALLSKMGIALDLFALCLGPAHVPMAATKPCAVGEGPVAETKPQNAT
jgi:hypothetical protein